VKCIDMLGVSDDSLVLFPGASGAWPRVDGQVHPDFIDVVAAFRGLLEGAGGSANARG